ncbi:MAG: hypothetical protein KDA86_21235 [Planctomycetaceae bacterium]|nr:hypothetical protein [Planctomycetaceae bacterium]
MTPDELRDLCQSNSKSTELAEAFSDLDEADRKRLSKAAQEAYRESRKEEQANWNQPTPASSRARLAVMACCPWSHARRIQASFEIKSDDNWYDALRQIISDRRPDWATQWISLQLDRDEWGVGAIGFSWRDVRDWMEEGVCELPECDGYYRALAIQGRGSFDPERDHALLEYDIWRLFEVETDAFSWMPPLKEIDRKNWANAMRSNVQQGALAEVYGGWPRILFYLSERGVIGRGRLIDATLAAFWRDFRGGMRTGLQRFYGVLSPTDGEIVNREAAYRKLLRNETGTVVALAIKALGRLQKAKRLDVAAFFDEVPNVFNISQKSQPKSALNLIDRIAKKAAEHRVVALLAMTAALNHEHADIQEQAVTLLSQWHAADPSLDLTDVLKDATMIAPQHRKTLEEMAGTSSSPSGGQGATQDSTPSDLDAHEQEIHERLAALPEWIRTVTCLDGIPDALASGELPPPFDPPTECPVLSGVEPIEPIKDADELIDVCIRTLAGNGDPEDEERVVEGIFQFRQAATNKLQEKTEGLRKAILDRLETASGWMGTVSWETDPLPLIVGRWLDMPEVQIAVTTSESDRIPAEFQDIFGKEELTRMVRSAESSARSRMTPLDWLMTEIFHRLDRNELGPVLSTPTHKTGWIDPRVFVERLHVLQNSRVTVGQREFIGGLLRLSPDHRNEALESSYQIHDPHGRIVRYALGGGELPTEKDRNHADEWLAAGRARKPNEPLPELDVLNLNTDEPDGLIPASYRFVHEIDPSITRHHRWAMEQYHQCLEITPNQPGQDAVKSRPSVALAARVLQANVIGWVDDRKEYQLASMTPLNTNATLAYATCQLLARIDAKSSSFEPVNGYMSPLLSLDRPWAEIGRVALCLGMLSRDEQARGIAIDVLIDGITDGRADGGCLGETLTHLAGGGWMKLNRLAEALREVTRTSVLAERVVGEILDQLIASWESLPRDGHHVLSLQVELLASLEHELSPKAREVLSSVQGSGKVAKMAKQLCAIKVSPKSLPMRQACLEAAEGRLARAERIALSCR